MVLRTEWCWKNNVNEMYVIPINNYIGVWKFWENLQEHREGNLSQIGGIIESPNFYDNCTAKEILEIHAQYMRYY